MWQPSGLEGNLTMCPRFLHPPKKAFLAPLVWPRRESLLICFENCQQGVSYSHRQSRNTIMNTFMLVNITPTCKFRGLIYACPPKNGLPSPFSLARNNTWALIWKKSLLICFESYYGIPYSHTGRVDREGGENFANG